jgi:hypothetical protein
MRKLSYGDVDCMHVDIETGELLHVRPLDTKRYIYPGRYLTMGLVEIKRLVDAKLPRDGYRLALLIAAKAVPVTGLANCPSREYAEELEISSERVSRLIGILEKQNFICRARSGLILVNPFWCFKGSPADHHRAVDVWMGIHPLEIVAAKTRKIA